MGQNLHANVGGLCRSGHICIHTYAYSMHVHLCITYIQDRNAAECHASKVGSKTITMYITCNVTVLHNFGIKQCYIIVRHQNTGVYGI